MVRYWHHDRHIDLWNRIEGPEITSSTTGKFIFNKRAKTTQWENIRLFSKWYSENGIPTCKSVTLDLYLTPSTKMN